MKAELRTSSVEVALICTEQEAYVLNHVLDYLDAKDWREKYSQKVDEEMLRSAFVSMRNETSRVLRAVTSSRKALREALGGARPSGGEWP